LGTVFAQPDDQLDGAWAEGIRRDLRPAGPRLERRLIFVWYRASSLLTYPCDTAWAACLALAQSLSGDRSDFCVGLTIGSGPLGFVTSSERVVHRDDAIALAEKAFRLAHQPTFSAC